MGVLSVRGIQISKELHVTLKYFVNKYLVQPINVSNKDKIQSTILVLVLMYTCFICFCNLFLLLTDCDMKTDVDG